ncbi:LacI family transcriptional regulator [Paenibacillus sp. N1-5-1-14]|uniref:LacI family DNA-binding transcriptional regulator n=1 Tax=Paenibacillus radicibacter TaxID=2972488 RepID=UPI0021592EB2|nr:LacI family DNA-binding transcriptional regulator [Paenibacillus radicibacter]MCR8643332.1 LacI family transcriptional regulator [Paenibacillus radicibacter]
MKVSIFDVAKRSGLSVVTVSRVLNNSHSVREKNREKVLKAVKELDYIPNSAARSLASGKTKIIGMTLTTLHDWIFDGIVNTVNRNLEEHGYFLALSIDGDQIGEPIKEEHQGVNFLFQEDRVDGIIVLSPLTQEKYMMELNRKQIPFVIVDSQDEDLDVSIVNVDNYFGGYEATKHLIDLGHKKIAHICGPELFLSVKERRRGYEAAMREAGLEPFITQSEFSIRAGFDVVKDWLRDDIRPTAVFAADDFVALGVMQAFQDEGYRVPDDVSIVGYDDQPFSREMHPRMTTVAQPLDEMGKHAVNLLLNKMSGSAKRNVAMKIKPTLLPRESTAYCK